MCQPSFTYSNASIQVISKLGKQQLIGSTGVKKQSSLMHKNMVETTKKASTMLVKSLDKMCMTSLEIEEKNWNIQVMKYETKLIHKNLVQTIYGLTLVMGWLLQNLMQQCQTTTMVIQQRNFI
jgi:hypothetical protein